MLDKYFDMQRFNVDKQVMYANKLHVKINWANVNIHKLHVDIKIGACQHNFLKCQHDFVACQYE